MKCVLMSIQSRHNRNIENRSKTSELRTRPPMCATPFKVFTYESGVNGRHMVTNEWICMDITTWRTYMGVPIHLLNQACVTVEELKKYSDCGRKDIAELRISDLVIYDTPKALSEFYRYCTDDDDCDKCEYNVHPYDNGFDAPCITGERKYFSRPPQSWCYVEEN